MTEAYLGKQVENHVGCMFLHKKHSVEMALQFLIGFLFCAGVVNSTFSCLTWELKEKSLSLICRIQNQFGPVSFIDSKGNIKATCTLNNPSKCETFQINGKAIANTYKNEVVFMINDYERKQFLNDEWTCSQGNRSMKTEVSTSRGILSDTDLKLLISSSSLQGVTLICFSCRAPDGHHAEFLKDDKSVDSIRYNMITGQCTHTNGECRSDMCSCIPSGNKFTRRFSVIAINKTTRLSCSMKFVDYDKSSIFSVSSTVVLKEQVFVYNETRTTIIKQAENEKDIIDEKRNMSVDGSNFNRTDSSPNILNPGEIIKWIGIGVAFVMPCIVAIVVKVCCRPCKNTKRRKDDNKLPHLQHPLVTTELSGITDENEPAHLLHPLASPELSGVPIKPSFFARYLENCDIELLWETLKSTLQNIDRYILQFTTDNWVSYKELSFPSNVRRYVMCDVQEDAVYRFRIFSCSNLVKSEPEVLLFVTRPKPINPRVGARYLKNGDIELSWEPSMAQLKNIDRYMICFTTDSWASITKICVHRDTRRYEINHVQEDAVYRFRIFSISKYDSEESKPEELELTFLARRVPIKPSFFARYLENCGIELLWESLKSTLQNIDRYIIQFTTDDWVSYEELSFPSYVRRYVMCDVQEDAVYRFRIFSCSNLVKSEPEVFLFVTPPKPINPGVVARYLKNGNIELSWEPPMAQLKNIDRYMIRFTTDYWASITKICLHRDTRKYEINDVQEDAVYWFQIFSIRKYDTEESKLEELELTFLTRRVPIKPSFLARYLENCGIELLWESLKSTLQNIDRYIIQFTTDDWVSYEELSFPSYVRRYVMCNVQEDAVYRFQIFSCRNLVKSEPEVFLFVTPPKPINPGVVARYLKNGNIELSWEPPMAKLKDIGRYMIRFTTDYWASISEIYLRRNTRKYEINDVQEDAVYWFQIFSISKYDSEESKLEELELTFLARR